LVEVEGVSPGEVDVVVGERTEPGDVVVVDVGAFSLGGGEGSIEVDGVPQDDGVYDESERAELVFLSVSVAPPEFAAVAVADITGEGVAGLASVEGYEDGAPVFFAVDVGEQVEGFRYATELGERRGEPAGAGAGVEGPDEVGGFDRAEAQGSGDA
jgi:hypothetical protein